MNSENPGTVIVTGGSSGLGDAVAHAVADAGGTPVVLDIQPPPNGFAFEQVDLSDPRAAEDVVRRVAEEHGGIDAVVTAAGVDACGDFHEVDADAWDRVVMVNLLGTVAVVRAALPYLEQVRGRVVTVASTLGLRVLPAATAYCASKWGVIGLTNSVALEVAKKNIRVNAIAPGSVMTPLLTDMFGSPQSAKDTVLPVIPMGRISDPSEIAQLVLFLSSDAASFITGQAVVIDGGGFVAGADQL